MRHSNMRGLPWAAAALLLCACKPSIYRVCTTIRPDGSFHRDILQPLDETLPPEALDRSEAGPQTQPSERRVSPAWAGKWKAVRTATAPADAGDGPYVQATGDFEEAEDIPPSYEVRAEPLDRASEDLISHDYEDYVLFGIDSWEEAISETISLPEYADAAGELLGMLLPAVEAGLEDVYGREFDLSGLRQHLESKVRPAIRKYLLWYYEYRPASLDDLGPQSTKELKSILAEAGFKLPVDSDGLVDTDASTEATKRFPATVLQDTVRHKDGGKLSEDDADDLWVRIQQDLGFDGQSESEPEEDAPRIRPAAYVAESQPTEDEIPPLIRAIEARLRKAKGPGYLEELGRLSVLLGGTHHNELGFPMFTGTDSEAHRSFEYRLKVPGPILESNGKRIAEQTLRWEFSDHDLFPEGYVMYAYSIRWNHEAEERLFGRVVLKDVATVSKLREAIPLEGPVHDALVTAVKQRSLTPIEALKDDEDSDVREAAEMILALKKKLP